VRTGRLHREVDLLGRGLEVDVFWDVVEAAAEQAGKDKDHKRPHGRILPNSLPFGAAGPRAEMRF
jgi:hypothetical protein